MSIYDIILVLQVCFTNCSMVWFQQLINNLDRDLQYAIRVEGKMDLESISNYDEVKNAIMEKVLIMIFDWPKFHVYYFPVIMSKSVLQLFGSIFSRSVFCHSYVIMVRIISIFV